MRSYPYSRSQISQKVGQLVTWLSMDASMVPLEQVTASWSETDWVLLQLAMLMQGVGPLLFWHWKEQRILDQLPPQIQNWLVQQYELNSQRMNRMQEELLLILLLTNKAGMRVMPLKGSWLAWHSYQQPGLRPMADLDLLIDSQDRERLYPILESLGYVFEPADSNVHSQHMVFKRPGSKVVSLEGEHPDNPRPVEVHWQLRKGVWGDLSQCDLTESMWVNAQQVEWCGVQIWRPEPSALAEYIAAHAIFHLLFYTGRLIQWVDLAYAANEIESCSPMYPNLFYAGLRITERALPTYLEQDAGIYSKLAHPRIVRWADDVPLDGRCGLTLGPPPFLVSRQHLHMTRWWPTRWRVRLGYYKSPLAISYIRHIWSWLVRLWEKSLLRTSDDWHW